MFRCTIRIPLRHTIGLPRRTFHSSPKSRLSIPTVDCIASHVQVNPLFQSLHDYTGLPWLVSIPLIAWLFRIPLTFVRFHLAFRRRDRHLAESELRLHARVIEEQAELKRKAISKYKDDKNIDEEIKKWKTNKWEEQRRNVRERFRWLDSNASIMSRTHSDLPSVAVWVIVADSITTLLHLSVNNGELPHFSMNILENYTIIPVWLGFSFLAFLNTTYYDDSPSSSTHQRETVLEMLNPTQWHVSALPVAAYCCLLFLPAPLFIYAISNTSYSFVERKVIDRVVGMPPTTWHGKPRDVVQIRRIQPNNGLARTDKVYPQAKY